MNILFIGQLVPDNLITCCTGYSVAGDTMIKNIVRGLGEIQGVQVDVISTLPNASFPKDRMYISSDTEEFCGSKIYNLGYINVPILKQLNQKKQFIKKAESLRKRKSYDLILCFNMYQQFGRAALFLQKKMNIPLVSVLADFPVEDKSAYHGGRRLLWNIVKRKTFENIGKLKHAIILNENSKKFLDKQCDYIVVPGGVPKDCVRDNIYKVENNTIVYAGALTKYSGVSNLIQAIQLIDEFECELEIYGEGELKDTIVACQKTDKRIKYMGVKSIEEMRDIMKKSWILINPRSTADPISEVTFPSKIFEYIMCGRPVISTAFKGIPNDIEKLIFSCKSGSAQEIKEEICRIKNMKADELDLHIKKSMEYIAENMNWEGQTQRMYSFFSKIVVQKNPYYDGIDSIN